MKRTPLMRHTPIRAKTPLKRTAMRKRSRLKSTPIRQSARGQSCTLNFPGCTNNADTTVLCHIRQFGGGGTGMKPPENESCYGCHYCHSVLDGRVPWILEPPEDFDFWKTVAFAIVKTQRAMRAKGLLIFKGEEAA